MSKITMELIKELREKTQVGMMDCKKALIESDGDIDKAIELLRKKGAAVASKRAGQATNNGIIATYVSEDNKVGSILEVSCETDFAANTEDMKSFANRSCQQLSKSTCETPCSPECLLENDMFDDSSKKVKTILDELIAKITENIKISRCSRFNAEGDNLINAYVHPGANLGVMIELEVKELSGDKKPVLDLAKDICMQIAVTNPLSIDPSQLDQSELDKEKSIIEEQLKASGKPENMIEKIMVGKVNKYYEEVCLVKQKYIKQDKIKIEQHINNIEKETNSKISIKRFERFAIGSK